jgi:hypothetical protein
MLDASPARLVQHGRIVIEAQPDGDVRVTCEGFEGEGTSCRDVAALATVWAIGVLQRELDATLMAPGGGSIGVD